MSEAQDGLRESYEAQVRSLTERVIQLEQRLSVLAEVASEIHGTESVPSVFEIALDKIREKLGVSAAWILTGEEGDQKLDLAAARGVSQNFIEEVRRHGLSECLCREVFWTGHSMLARNTSQCPRMPQILGGSDGSVVHACVPLSVRGGSRGVLNVAAPAGRVFSEGELLFLETLGHQIGLAVERARGSQEAREQQEEARNAYRKLRAAQGRIVEQERAALIGTFAAGLAHEIRNPLNSIALQLAVIERRDARHEGDTGIRELIGVIRQEVSRLDALAGDFLQFSRSDRVQQAPVEMEEVVTYVLKLLEPQAVSAGVRLTREGVTRLPPLLVDADRMKQVLINLVRNAIEATPSGGAVTVKEDIRGDSAILSVEDNGSGLPENVNIFELFVTTKPSGTGLGLSIVNQIVAQHGGEVTARNRPEGGARFEISLPLGPLRGRS